MTQLLIRSSLNGIYGWGKAAEDTEAVVQAKQLALQRAKVAATALLTIPGVPFIYYGEELGLTGRRYKNNDVDRRFAIPWVSGNWKAVPTAWWTVESDQVEEGQNKDTPSVEAQLADPASLLSHYAKLGQARQGIPALGSGDFNVPVLEGYNLPSLVAYGRASEAQSVLVLMNRGSEALELPVPAGMSLLPLWDSDQGMRSDKTVIAAGKTYKLSGYQSMILEIKL